MKNIGNIIKRLQNTMRKDQGVSGDAQRIEQLGWMIALKILDDKDQELEIIQDGYLSPIPSTLQWRNWAANAEGMTGDELKNFIDQQLFPGLMNLDIATGNKRALLVREIFEGTNNYMKNGTIIRQVMNELNQIDFNSSEDRHIFGDIYETILRDLQSAGNYGEFYTPRALTEFMTETVNPRLGEKVLDPACGTGGFLTCAIENIRRQDVKSVEDLKLLQETIHGMEFKPLPFMLSVTNLILHDIEVPNVDYTDSLNREYTSITAKDRVDVILANPPFGASVTDGVETNFPLNYRTTESADLFLLLMIRYLKDSGRAAIVLPDGSLTGDGVKQRIRQHWLENCNLHTIVRLPNPPLDIADLRSALKEQRDFKRVLSADAIIATQMIESWFFYDIDGIYKFLKVPRHLRSSSKYTPPEKFTHIDLSKLFGRNKKIYIKGHKCANFINNLEISKIYRDCKELKDGLDLIIRQALGVQSQ